MNGFSLVFFTYQESLIEDTPAPEWLLNCARDKGLSGATIQTGTVSFGHHGEYHSSNMFDFSDQPVQVKLVVDADEKDAMLSAVKQANAKLFYTVHPVEFGYTTD